MIYYQVVGKCHDQLMLYDWWDDKIQTYLCVIVFSLFLSLFLMKKIGSRVYT